VGLENGGGSLYAIITVEGNLERPLPVWLEYIRMFKQEDDRMVLLGQFTDQPALRGFLDQLWNLNFSLCSVEKIDT
jgi:hypothetical protein